MVMKHLIKEVEDKLNHMIWALVFYAAAFLLLAVFIAFTEYFLRIMVGFAFLLLAYVMFYFAYKVWTIKKIINK